MTLVQNCFHQVRRFYKQSASIATNDKKGSKEVHTSSNVKEGRYGKIKAERENSETPRQQPMWSRNEFKIRTKRPVHLHSELQLYSFITHTLCKCVCVQYYSLRSVYSNLVLLKVFYELRQCNKFKFYLEIYLHLSIFITTVKHDMNITCFQFLNSYNKNQPLRITFILGLQLCSSHSHTGRCV